MCSMYNIQRQNEEGEALKGGTVAGGYQRVGFMEVNKVMWKGRWTNDLMNECDWVAAQVRRENGDDVGFLRLLFPHTTLE